MVRFIYVWLRLQVVLQTGQWFKKKLCVKKYGKRRACVVSKGDGCPWGWVVQREGLDAGSRVRRDEGPLTSAAALKTQEGPPRPKTRASSQEEQPRTKARGSVPAQEM